MIRLLFSTLVLLNIATASVLRAHRSRRHAVVRQRASGSLSRQCQYLTSESVQIYSKCPDVCSPFDPAEDDLESFGCDAMAQHGCVLKKCNFFGSANGYSCALDRSKVREEADECGGKVFFREIELNDESQRVPYYVELNAPPALTDVYFVADTTFSMNDHFENIQDSIEDLLIEEDDSALWFGGGQYRDERDFGSNKGFRPEVRMTTDYERFIDSVVAWTGAGGYDTEEANLVALYRIAKDSNNRIGWRRNSRKFVVLFGDAPGHEPSCAEPDGPVITRQTIIDELNKRNITAVFVNFGRLDRKTKSFPTDGTPCGGTTHAPAGQASHIAAATGGKVFAGKDIGKFVDFVLNERASVKRTYALDESDCDGLVQVQSSFPATNFPVQVSQSDSEGVIVTQTVNIKPGTCTSRTTPFKCNLVYRETGNNLSGGGLLHFVDIKGC